MYNNFCKRISFYRVGCPILSRSAGLKYQSLTVNKKVVACRICNASLSAIMEQIVPSPGDGRETCHIEPISCKSISTGLTVVRQSYLWR